MKKTYIAPQTEMEVLASQGIMQQALGIMTGSSSEFSDVTEID